MTKKMNRVQSFGNATKNTKSQMTLIREAILDLDDRLMNIETKLGVD